MISPNSYEVTFDAIQKVRLKEPDNAGHLWEGIRHSTFLDAVFDTFPRNGLKIRTSRYALSKDKRDLVADFDVNLSGYTPLKGWVPSIGIISSNGGKIRTRIVIGMTHLKTETGFVGRLIPLAKRTKGFDLTEIEEAVKEFRGSFPGVEAVIELLGNTELTQGQIDRIIMRASRCRPVSPTWWTRPTWEALGNTLKLYKEGEDKSALGLMLAYGQVTKKSNTFRQIPQLLRFRQILSHAIKVKV